MSMPTLEMLPKWLLEAAARSQPPPADLGSVASAFLALLYTDPQWVVVQQELERLSRDRSIEGVLRRQQEALLGIVNKHRREPQDPVEIAVIAKAREEAQLSLALELENAEAAYRARVVAIVEQIAEPAKAGEQPPRDSRLRQAAVCIARTAVNADLSRLGPYWPVIVLYWLIVHLTAGELAALTLWYMVVSDTVEKKD